MKKIWTDKKLKELLYLLEVCTTKQIAAHYKITIGRIYQLKRLAKLIKGKII